MVSAFVLHLAQGKEIFKRVRCYYGGQFIADAVHGTGIVNTRQSFHVLQTRDQDNHIEVANEKLQPESNTLQPQNISVKIQMGDEFL